MNWTVSWRADPRGARIADRHYNRQKVGSPQFVPPGSCLVLTTPAADALWITSWPFPEYVRHAWPGAWVCSVFRNEAPLRYRSSDLIREAVAATRAEFGIAPDLGMVTFIDERKVRHKRDPGRCFLRAGFKRLKERTKEENLIVLQMLPEEMPLPAEPVGFQRRLIA